LLVIVTEEKVARRRKGESENRCSDDSRSRRKKEISTRKGKGIKKGGEGEAAPNTRRVL